MLFGVIMGLIAAYLLTFIGVENLLIEGISELTGKSIGISGYYTIFALIGLFGGVFKYRK